MSLMHLLKKEVIALMNQPTVKINSCPYGRLNENTPVFNLNQIEHDIFIYLEPEICRPLQLFQMDNIDSTESKEISLSGFVEREGTCWLRIKSEILDLNGGQHVYKLSFVDSITNDVVPLFFSYIIQDDNPEKPYVYMKEGSTSTVYCPYVNSKYSQ